MRIPRQTLRSTATIIDYGGSGARGPVYAAGRSVRCRIEATSKLTTDLTGRTVSVDIKMMIRPEDGPVKVESVVMHAGVGYRVVQSYPMPDDHSPFQWELGLTRTAVPSGVGGS